MTSNLNVKWINFLYSFLSWDPQLRMFKTKKYLEMVITLLALQFLRYEILIEII